MNEAQALTIAAGKHYRTRLGHKAIVLARNPFNDGVARNEVFLGAIDYPERFYQQQGCPDAATTWGPTGRFYATDEESPFDLVAEWVEPKRIKGWIAMSDNLSVGLEPTKDGALKRFKTAFGREATVCVEIDVLEGHGLNGEAA